MSGGKEEQLRAIIESLSDAVFILSMEGNFIDVNRTAYERLGYSREEMLSMHITQLDPPEFAERVPERLSQIREHGVAVFESAHLRKDGKVMPVEVNSRIADYEGEKVYLSVIRDITDRKVVEETLRESEEKYKKLFNNSIDAISIFSMKSGRILDVNGAFLKLYGYSREEALQLTVDDISAEPERSREAIQKASASGDTFIPVRRHRKKDGTGLFVEISAGPFTWKGQKVMYAVARDITERREAEEAINEYALKLEHSNYMKDLFTDILSHDLLNPVTVIAAASRHLEGKVDTALGGDVSMIVRNSTKLMELIKDASICARVESAERLEKQESDLTLILSSAVERIQHLAGDAKRRVILPPGDRAPLPANAIIEEVFTNILSNAFKYSPENEEVTVTVTEDEHFRTVSFADRGEGVPDAVKKGIFDRFTRRAKEGVRGNGLGLAIAKRIVDLHQGRIWVEDNPGGGSIFKVSLPKKAAEGS